MFMHNVYSEWGRITHVVPQGSVLGPLHFCLHINDLLSCIQNCKIHMFADDISIQCISKSFVDLEHSLQKDLNVANVEECQKAKSQNICNADHKCMLRGLNWLLMTG